MVSQNFDYKNFEIMEELELALDDKEDLSPFERKQIEGFNKKEYNVQSSQGQEIVLANKYTAGVDLYKVNIHFTKIKPHKQALRKALRQNK